MYAITYHPCWNWSSFIIVKGPLVSCQWVRVKGCLLFKFLRPFQYLVQRLTIRKFPDRYLEFPNHSDILHDFSEALLPSYPPNFKFWNYNSWLWDMARENVIAYWDGRLIQHLQLSLLFCMEWHITYIAYTCSVLSEVNDHTGPRYDENRLYHCWYFMPQNNVTKAIKQTASCLNSNSLLNRHPRLPRNNVIYLERHGVRTLLL